MDFSTARVDRFSLFTFLLFVGLLTLPNGLAKEKQKRAQEKTEVEEKAASIVIPQIEFADTPVWDAVEFLVARSRELDVDEPDPQERGINIVLIGNYEDDRISMRLSQVPLDAVLQAVADLVDARLEPRSEVLLINRSAAYDAVSRQDDAEPLESQLRRLILPSVEFLDTPLRDAVEFLQQRSVEIDAGSDSVRKGVNLVLKEIEPPATVSLRLKNTSLYSALEVLAIATDHEMEIREHMVFLQPVVIE